MNRTNKIYTPESLFSIKNRTRKVYPSLNVNVKTQKKEQMGWKIMELSGGAFDRGYQHGTALYSELAYLKRAFPNMVRKNYKTSFIKYEEKCRQVMPPDLFAYKWPEWKTELDGIAAGALKMGVVLRYEFLLCWNMYLSMASYYDSESKNNKNESSRKRNIERSNERCSAFIATGDATADGKIVIAHNTHASFEEATISNIISYIYPDQGHSFMMQTMPGLISSTMDWFISSTGLVGCETTISDFKPLPNFPQGSPYFCRVRECMQYGSSIDEYVYIMVNGNAGDYACSWLFGDIQTGEIARLELGKSRWALDRTKSGAYVGANWVVNDTIRQLETGQKVGDPCFLRNMRLEELVYHRYWGKMNEILAKRVLADHYDPHNGNIHQKNGYSICRHMESEKQEMPGHDPHDLYGTIDGKVTTTEMAKKMGFWGRWGSSCGRSFSKEEHSKKYPEYRSLLSWITNFSSKPWTKIGPDLTKNLNSKPCTNEKKIEQLFIIHLS